MGLLKELIFSFGKQHGTKQPTFTKAAPPTQDAKAWEALLLTHHPSPAGGREDLSLLWRSTRWGLAPTVLAHISED